MRSQLTSALLALCLLRMAHAQATSHLSQQMEALRVHTALLIRSHAIDDLPTWSPDGRFIAANVQGRWFKIDVSATQLHDAEWHGQRIGVETKPALHPMTDGEVHDWSSPSQRPESDAVTTESGLKIEMQHHEMSSSLVVSDGAKQLVIWKSDLENCYGLTLSPDKINVAYLCELNGVLVTDPERAFKSAEKRP